MKGLIPLFIIVPLGCAFLIPIFSKIWKRFSEIIEGIGTLFILLLSFYFLFNLKEPMVYPVGGWFAPFGIVFVLDKLSVFFVVIIALIWFLSYLFAINYMDRYTGGWKFYTLFSLIHAGMFGVAITGDLFNLFVFLEIASVSSYALVGFSVEEEGLEAGFKYMVMGEIASLFILLAIAFIYASFSTLNMADISVSLYHAPRNAVYYFVLGLLCFGFLLKSACVPFHSWLPDAHPAAPAPVSSVLSGVFIKILGIYSFTRIIFNVFGLSRENAGVVFDVIVVLGILSIIVGGVTALVQKDYKRILAYSSISQIGYILAGIGIGNLWGVTGALMHVLAHAMGKGLLFLTSGSVVYKTEERDIEKIAGFGARMPWTGYSYLLGMFSMAGIPPFVGFFSKLFLIIGAVQANMYVVAGVFVVFSVVTFAYLLRIENKVFWQKGVKGVADSPFLMILPMVILAFLLFAAGIVVGYILTNFVKPAAYVLLKGIMYAKDIIGGGI